MSRILGAVALTVALTAAGVTPALADTTQQPVQPDPAVAAPVPPAAGTSHYIRSLLGSQTVKQVRAATTSIGRADGAAASTSAPQVTLLQFGAQTNRAGGDGSGSGSTPGIRQTSTDMRLTYPQVAAAVQGYIAGYVAGRAASSQNTLTVVVGTNTSGFEGATYTPAAKGKDWANQVIEPVVTYAQRSAPRVTVAAGDDIEPNFDAEIGEVKTWINNYLRAGPNPLVNNGAAVGCPTKLGQTGRRCSPVPVEDSSEVHTWSQADHFAVSGGISPSRISLLPQIYVAAQAPQWENVDRTGGGTLTFTGVLTSVAACAPANSGCTSLDPGDAWTLMTQTLQSSPSTASTSVPAVTDLTVS